jgi:hypothetical protein
MGRLALPGRLGREPAPWLPTLLAPRSSVDRAGLSTPRRRSGQAVVKRGGEALSAFPTNGDSGAIEVGRAAASGSNSGRRPARSTFRLLVHARAKVPERLRATVAGFVDVHSHPVPSGDEGARSIEEAVELCELARAGGTRVLFATPHAHADWDRYPLTPERELLFAEAFPVVSRAVSASGLELRPGWEVFPTVLRNRDPHEFLLEGTRAVLLEFPICVPCRAGVAPAASPTRGARDRGALFRVEPKRWSRARIRCLRVVA